MLDRFNRVLDRTALAGFLLLAAVPLAAIPSLAVAAVRMFH
jgi:hypothetical protein